MSDQYMQMRDEIGRSILEVCESGALGIVVEPDKMIPCLQQYQADIFQGDQLNMEPVWLYLLLYYPDLSPVQLRSAFSPLESDAVIWQLYLRWPVPSNLQAMVEQHQRQGAAHWLKEKILSSPIGSALAPHTLESLIQKVVAEKFRNGTLDIAALEEPLANAAKTSPSFVKGILVQLSKSPPFPSLRVVLGELVEESAAGPGGGSTPGFQKTMDILIHCLQETRMQDIIDPEKLEMFLNDELESMWDVGAYRLSELWDVFQEAPGVRHEMIEEYFVWLRELTKGKGLALEFPSQMSKLTNAVVEERLASVRDYNAQLDDVMGAIPSAPSPPSPPPPSAAMPPPKPSAPTPSKPPTVSESSAAQRPVRPLVQPNDRPKFPGKDKEKDKPTPKLTAPSRSRGGAPGIRQFLGAGVGAALLVWLVLYVAILRTPKASWGGDAVVGSSYYKVIAPEIMDIRVRDQALYLRVNSNFSSLEEPVRVQRLELCFYLARGKYKTLNAVHLFSETGSFVSTMKIVP
ncbi:MAG: hypothetical protein H6727_08605 [Myxococcales bacterium]|nr:hypothetical protein [Myxococcales bacterium]